MISHSSQPQYSSFCPRVLSPCSNKITFLHQRCLKNSFLAVSSKLPSLQNPMNYENLQHGERETWADEPFPVQESWIKWEEDDESSSSPCCLPSGWCHIFIGGLQQIVSFRAGRGQCTGDLWEVREMIHFQKYQIKLCCPVNSTFTTYWIYIWTHTHRHT